jgi:Pvc16 N-terminal domain
MIDNALKFIANEVNKYVVRKIDPLQDPSISKLVVLGNVAKAQDADPTGGSNPLQGKAILTLVNVEEDRVSKLPMNYVKVGERIEYRNPKVFLNLYLMFAVNNTAYDTSLQYLSMIIQCFQYKNVINHQNSPDSTEAKLDPRIDKLIFDLHTLGFEQLNQLWAVLGGKYLPSVVYKMRLVTIEDQTPDMQGDPITSISILDGGVGN